MTKSWNKNHKITRTKEGLVVHHKFEDHAIMLSTKEYAIKNPFDWQLAHNMVYCDYQRRLHAVDKARFKARIYFIDKLKKVDNSVKSVENKDGTLYSGWYKTKIRAEELPDWYIFGTYYKRRGFMSAKGIIDMVYCPSKYSDDFLKDDILLVSYKDKIELREHGASIYDAYVNYDEVVSGVNIIKIIRAAREYSDYDIGDLISDLQAQKDWLTATFPRKAKKEGWDKPAEDMFMNWC